MSRSPAVLSGELGLIGLFDLGQLLMLNRATGCLALHSEDRRGALYFQDGRLINAVDDALAEGEEAACRLFAWRTGTFEFQPGSHPGQPRIQSGTEAVMLEAARRLDETETEPDAAPSSGEETRLRERRLQLEALRDVFHRITGEARREDRASTIAGPLARLYELERPGDCLIYRPGHPPRLRTRGGWHESLEPAVPPPAYEELRIELLQSCTAVSAVNTGAAATRRLELTDGPSIALEFVNEGPDESLWLRPVELLAPGPECLAGDRERLAETLALCPAFVLAGAAAPEGALRLVHALVSLLATHEGVTVLVASRDETYRHADGAGVVLRTQPEALDAKLRAVRPDVLALDPGDASASVTVAHLESAPRILAGVVAPHPAALLPRWITRVGGSDADAIRALLAVSEVTVVMGDGEAAGDGEIVFQAWRLSPDERLRAMEGDPVIFQRDPDPRRSPPRLEIHRS